MRFALRAVLPAAAFGALVVIACAPPEDPAIGAPNGILGRQPPSAVGDGGAAPPSGNQGVACTEADWAKDDDAACAVKWSTDIFPKVTGAWNCTLAGACHQPGAPGGSPAALPLIDKDNAATAFKQLAEFKNDSLGRVYINPCSKVLGESAFHGNISGTVGKVMPPGSGVSVQADKDQLKTWIECGAPNN
jgi:hypothetical protein